MKQVGNLMDNTSTSYNKKKAILIATGVTDIDKIESFERRAKPWYFVSFT